jgi:hypothetical protein
VTEDETLHGETFTFTVSSNYETYITDTQTIKLTIYGPCEDQTPDANGEYYFSVDTPEAVAYTYLLGSGAKTFEIPAFTVTPETCVQTLVVTFPEALTICEVSEDDANEISCTGALEAVTAKDYSVTVQPKTAAGFLVNDAILTITLTVTDPEEEVVVTPTIVETITTSVASNVITNVVLATATAAVGATAAIAG